MASRLTQRLLEAHHRQFVGREAERALFQSALQADELPFFLLHIYGPGGIGKTGLLQEFLYLCHTAEVPAHYLDARTFEATPSGFLEALRTTMQLPSGASPTEALASSDGRAVLMVDTYEVLISLENWLRHTFLPQLTDNILVILAGRSPLSHGWRSGSGWSALIHTIPLRNLSPDEGRTYLSQAGIPDVEHDAVLQFTHGHALALSLVSEVFAQRPDLSFSPDASPDVIKALLDRFVTKVPSPARRAALEACALVQFMTEPLLAAMVDTSEEHGLFEWLRSLSFIESGNKGLFPHDLARDVLTADLRWRNPDRYRALHQRARVYYNNRLPKSEPGIQREVLEAYVYLHRDNPIVRPYLTQLQAQWRGQAHLMSDQPKPDDWPLLKDMVEKHEGPESAQHAAHWFERQPHHVMVYRGHDGQPEGFLLRLALDEADPDDLMEDPGTAIAWRYLAQHAPLRRGEKATMFRFWMARESYQDISPVQSLVFVSTVRHYLTTPGLAVTLLPCANPEFWSMIFAYADLQRLPAADFEIDGTSFGVYGHDWRVTTPVAWLDLLAARETQFAKARAVEPKPDMDAIIVLSKESFADAVWDALRAYTHPTDLSDNPLLHSRVVIETLDGDTSDAARIEALQSLLLEAADQLKAGPRLTKYYRVLDRTYFRPASTQESAAELLDLPFSTYRRHLKAGIDEVAAWLWQHEIGA